MCEYQRVKDNKMPTCEYTGKECTFCVLGNFMTYNQAKLDERKTANAKQQTI